MKRELEIRGNLSLIVEEPKPKNRERCNPEWSSTPNLSNVKCGKRKGCSCLGDGIWCFLPTTISLTPSEGWKLVEFPWPECKPGGTGTACGWNLLDREKDVPKDRFAVVNSTETKMTARIHSNSGSFDVRLCAFETAPDQPTEIVTKTFNNLQTGSIFLAEVPIGNTALLRGSIDNSDVILKAGEESQQLELLSPESPEEQLIFNGKIYYRYMLRATR